jgi:hypothetical protein
MVKRASSPSFDIPKNKKPKFLYLRTYETEDLLIDTDIFPRGTTLQKAIQTIKPKILEEGSLFASEEDSHDFSEVSKNSSLFELKSGTVVIPVYKLCIFYNQQLLIPRCFTGYELYQYIKVKYFPNSFAPQFMINNKKIDLKLPLHQQNIKDNYQIRFLSAPEEKDCFIGDEEEAQDNSENFESEDNADNTLCSFDYISPSSKKIKYHISSFATFSQLIHSEKLCKSLQSYLANHHFTMTKASDFELCFLDARGKITPIKSSIQTVDQIPEPKTLVWRYKYCAATFQQKVDQYIREGSIECLTFLGETLYVVDDPSNKVFLPIYHEYKLTDADDNEIMLKIQNLISHLKTKAQLFMTPSEYDRLINFLKEECESLPFVN